MRAWFFILAASFTIGIFIRSLYEDAGKLQLLFLIAAISTFFVYPIHRTRSVFFVSLVFLGAMLGIVRFEISELAFENSFLRAHSGETVFIEGIVSDEPDVRDDIVFLTVRAESLRDGASRLAVNGEKIRVAAERFGNWRYGDRITARGLLLRPEKFEGANGKLFDYPGYLSAKGIYFEIKSGTVSLIGRGEGNQVLSALYSFKEKFLGNLARVIPEPEESLLAGIIVGAKESLGKDLLLDFRKVGLIHIVVLSGYNVTIVADSIVKFFSFLPALYGSILASSGIIFFAALVGGGATVIRASIMALLVVFARYLGRVYDVTTALVLAGFMMLVQNPKILVFDPSFQLSFLATVGLIYFSPFVEKYVRFLPERFGARDIARATLATQIFVTPFLLYLTGSVSLVSFPANLMSLAVVPSIMFLGFLGGALGFIHSALVIPFGYVATVFLSYILFVTEKFSALPFSSYTFQSVSIAVPILCYAIFSVLLFRRFVKIKE
mgnify:CR=1 FL=1